MLEIELLINGTLLEFGFSDDGLQLCLGFSGVSVSLEFFRFEQFHFDSKHLHEIFDDVGEGANTIAQTTNCVILEVVGFNIGKGHEEHFEADEDVLHE